MCSQLFIEIDISSGQKPGFLRANQQKRVGIVSTNNSFLVETIPHYFFD